MRWKECEIDVNWGWNTVLVSCDNNKCTAGPLDICAMEKRDDTKSWRKELYDCKNPDNSLECETLPHIFDAILAMVVVSAIAMFIVLFLVVLRRTMNLLLYVWTDKNTHLLLAAFALICGLVGVLVFAFAIPAAYRDAQRCDDINKTGCKFSGSTETKLEPITDNVVYIWGPGSGWIVEVINLGLMACFIVIYTFLG